RDSGGARPQVPLDRGLRVSVDMVEQREAADERMDVGRSLLPEESQRRVAVAARVVAEHLIVGAVLADDVEDMLDRPAATERRVGRRRLRGRRYDLSVGRGRQPGELVSVARRLLDADASEGEEREILEAVRVVVVRGERVRAVRVRAAAKALRSEPDERVA